MAFTYGAVIWTQMVLLHNYEGNRLAAYQIDACPEVNSRSMLEVMFPGMKEITLGWITQWN